MTRLQKVMKIFVESPYEIFTETKLNEITNINRGTIAAYLCVLHNVGFIKKSSYFPGYIFAGDVIDRQKAKIAACKLICPEFSATCKFRKDFCEKINEEFNKIPTFYNWVKG